MKWTASPNRASFAYFGPLAAFFAGSIDRFMGRKGQNVSAYRVGKRRRNRAKNEEPRKSNGHYYITKQIQKERSHSVDSTDFYKHDDVLVLKINRILK